jgi:hypothetical protein
MGAGERSDTVRNVRANPAVTFRVREQSWDAEARVVTDAAEAALVRRLIPKKYADQEEGLEEWAEEALPVAIDLPT